MSPNNGHVKLTNYSGSQVSLDALAGAAVSMYYNNSKKFETVGGGVSVSNGGSDTATIYGPGNLTIDPAPVDDNGGIVRIKGDLYVDGTNFVVDSETITLADFVVGIASTATSDVLTDGAGIGIGTNKTFLYYYNSGTDPSLKSSENLNVASGKSYQIDQSEVLNSTTLGVGVTFSSLTTVGIITSGEWRGTSISNTYLAESTVSFGGVELSLGGSDDTPAFNLVNATGLPISTGVDGLATGIADFLATPSSANLASAVTDETGTGALVFASSPALDGEVVVGSATTISSQGINAPTGIITASIIDSSFNDVLPSADATYDLGSPTYRWDNIYTTDLQLSNEGSANDVDGTWGKWTIQEGEEDLFIINRRTGKKYKFLLEEVQ